MAMESIYLKVISGKDLKSFNFFQKPSIYSLVSIGTGDRSDKSRRRQTQKTPIDREGGHNPEWNHEMSFDLNQIPSDKLHLHFLEFDFLLEGIFGEKIIGEVYVPISDLMDGSDGILRFVSYQIRSTDGNPNGVLSFSYRVHFKGKIASYPSIDASPVVYSEAQGPAPAPLPAPAPVPLPSPPMLGYFAPPPEMACFYPPPPPPPPPMGFPVDPYFFRPPEYGCESHGYPTGAQYQPYNEDTWRRGFGF